MKDFRPFHPARVVMLQRHITGAELARHVGLATGYVREMLAGTRPASPEFRRRVSEVLDLPQRELFAGIEPDDEAA